MTELEKLIEQKKEIERQIKALTCPKVEVDGAKFERKTYRGKPVDTWVVRLQEIGGRAEYKEVVMARTKEECIEQLGILVDTLTNLYSKVRQL